MDKIIENLRSISSSRLSQAIKESGLKQIEIADKAGYSPEHLSAMKKKRQLSREAATRLAPVLNKPVWWLMGEEKPSVMDRLTLNQFMDECKCYMVDYQIELFYGDNDQAICSSPSGERSVTYKQIEAISESFDIALDGLKKSFAEMMKRTIDSSPDLKPDEIERLKQHRNGYPINPNERELFDTPQDFERALEYLREKKSNK